MDAEQDDEVGYRKPPKRTRFRKGESGNPKGRPKGARNLKTDLMEELNERIFAREGGSTVEISKQRAVLKSLVARTVKGDARAAATLLNTIFRVLDPTLEVAEPAAPLSAEEREVLAAVESRLLLAPVANRDPETTDPGKKKS